MNCNDVWCIAREVPDLWDVITCPSPWYLLLPHKSSFETHDDVIKWKHFPRYCPFVRGHRSTVNSPHKGQWRGALMFCLICVWINVWVNNRKFGDLRRYLTHYDVIVMRYARKGLLLTKCTNKPLYPRLLIEISIKKLNGDVNAWGMWLLIHTGI